MSDGPSGIITLSDIARGMSMGLVEERLVKATLMGLTASGETADDVLSFARPFLEVSVRVPTRHPVVLDMCGTGGAPFRTFNVSTLASIVVSSCGVPVAKHGNRSNGGKCGSADLMEALGYDIMMGPDRSREMLDEVGFAFLFAPNYHPSMRHVVPMRREIGKRTVFNLLGPLLNPVMARKQQLVGVADPDLMDVIADSLSMLGIERALVVHGYPGMDEVSALGPTMCIEVCDGRKNKFEISPKMLEKRMPVAGDLGEMAPKEAASLAYDILDHKVEGRSEMVSLNAACGLYVFGKARSFREGLEMSNSAMFSGKASAQLGRILSLGGVN
ncbi:MAG: anthranilate phosphoribosyltransferase [Methanomassiliicoccales archaeon]|nr:MAG: anthranilate phosphoribosyltransferase [Methanomassiliicoccales archaeon]